VSPRTITILRWSLLALLGLVAAVAVGVAAAALTSRQIGLSSEPIRAGEALAPRSAGGKDHGRKHDRKDDSGGGGHGSDDSTTTTTTQPTTTPTTTTATPPATTAAPPTTTSSDDSGGGGDGDDD
jgi:hypothetical protein